MTLGAEQLREMAEAAPSRADFWVAFAEAIQARRVAEVGVYRGDFAARLLDGCPGIETYYMIDPWRHLEDWDKPANKSDDRFERFLRETLEKTEAHARKRVVLRGRTTEVADEIPDGTLEFAYVDGDHTLRGITIDLIRILPKVRDGGWIGGDDFSPSIWQHRREFEPTLVFPYAVHFAEAIGARIHGLPRNQFLIHKVAGGAFELVDLTGRYGNRSLKHQLTVEQPGADGAGSASRGRRPLPPDLLGRVRRRVSRAARRRLAGRP